MRIAAALIVGSLAAPVFATLPPPTPEAKAQAALAAEKSAWSDKVGQYKQCLVVDRVAERYRASEKAGMKDVAPAIATPACVDPGPFVASADLKPLEAAGAHSPPATATSPPSSNATHGELTGA